MRPKYLLVLLFLLLLVSVHAADSYKPYLHKPSIPDSPGVRLFGQYDTLLFPGAATYSYPIEVPPGTHGMQPSIVVAYNSQSVQQRPGILGSGWSINQNYVYRDVNSTPNDPSDDRFLLVFQNNVYELIYGTQDNQWHTEVDYHYRIQNLTTTTNNDSLYWVLTTTDGTQYRFGATFSSERASNTGRPYAVKWYLDQVTDTYGNTITYNYAQDPNPEDTGTAYLTAIAYNTDQRRKILFTYEPTARPDLRLAYEQGNKVAESRRLTDITVLADGSLVRRYHFNYTLLSPTLSSLASITRYGADNTSILHAIRFTYDPAIPGYNQSASWQPPVAFDNTTGGDTGVRLIDVNNDGFADIIQGAQRNATKNAWLNNGAGGFTPAGNWSPPVYLIDNSGNDTGVRFADVNNDGLTDLLVSKAGTSQVYLNNGTGWVLSNWTIPFDFVDAAGSDQGVQLADIDGDGRVDLMRAKAGLPNAVYINNGAGWTNRTSAWSVPVVFNNGTDTGARLVDINGDGLPDILQANGTGRKAWLNNGAGWTDASTTWSVPVDFRNTTYQDTGVRFVDVDGDGLPDLVQNLVNGTITINNTWLNNGTGWTLNNSWTTPTALVVNGSNVGRRLADVNGDNSADLLTSTNGTAQNTWTKNPGTPFLLARITNEYGGTVAINYTTSTQYNNTDANAAGTIGFNIFVVNSIVKNNNLSGTMGVLGLNNYSYQGGKYNYTKREFRGFSTTTEQTPSALVKHYFLQDSPRRGKEYTTEVYSINGTLFSRSVTDFNYTTWYGVYNVTLRSATNYQYDGASNPRITSTLYAYDWFGNPAELLHTPRGTVTEKRVLTLQQATVVLAALDLRERLIVKLAGTCGMRPGEIVALQWHDITEKSLTVQRRLYRGKIDTPKTRNSTRKVALPTSVVADINEWRLLASNTQPDAWVFPSENGKTPLWANNAWYDKIRPTLSKFGLGWVNYQVLRRSAVTLLNAQGADGTIVAAQCGHTVDVSTNVYNHVGIERQLQAVQKLDNALAPPASRAS